MARDCEGLVRDDVRGTCILRCRQRRSGASDQPSGDEASARETVDWAGLPVNLDYAFSQEQRDKVYEQHVMRKHRAQMWRWSQGASQLCVCEIEFANERLEADAATSMTGR